MRIGIIGLPMVGKTTIFSLLTGLPVEQRHDTGIAKVHDSRVDELAKIYQPKKMTYATLEFIDTVSLKAKSDEKERNAVFSSIQNVDALLLVLRSFVNPAVPEPEGAKKPMEQLGTTMDEFVFRDFDIVSNRINKLENAKRKLENREEKELEVLKKVVKYLENGESLAGHRSEFTDEEVKLVSSYSLTTLKPVVVAVNVDEKQFEKHSYEDSEKIKGVCGKNNFGYIEICGQLELEINQLEESERADFLKELGTTETGIQRLSNVVYKCVGLISFFTVGKDEVRAWTLKKNSTAIDAAGTIHSDLARGFIKAEIIKYSDLISVGSEKEVKDKNLFKLVGKDHQVDDGDIINIRFNVKK